MAAPLVEGVAQGVSPVREAAISERLRSRSRSRSGSRQERSARSPHRQAPDLDRGRGSMHEVLRERSQSASRSEEGARVGVPVAGLLCLPGALSWSVARQVRRRLPGRMHVPKRTSQSQRDQLSLLPRPVSRSMVLARRLGSHLPEASCLSRPSTSSEPKRTRRRAEIFQMFEQHDSVTSESGVWGLAVASQARPAQPGGVQKRKSIDV